MSDVVPGALTLQHLHELSTQLLRATDTQGLYERVLDSAVRLMRSQGATLQLLVRSRGPEGELLLLHHRGLTAGAAEHWRWVTPGHGTPCGIALRQVARVVVEDVVADERIPASEAGVFLMVNFRAVQTTPLFSRNGELLGMISTLWNRPHVPSAPDLEMFDIIAQQAAYLIERHLSEDALQRASAIAAFRLRLSDALRSLGTPAQVKKVASAILGMELAANRVAYAEIAGDHAHVESDYVVDVPPLPARYPLGETTRFAVREFRAGRTVIIDDVRDEMRMQLEERQFYEHNGARAFVVVSLIKNDVWVGSLAVHCLAPRRWSRDEVSIIEYTAERTWEAVERARAEAALLESYRNKDLFLAMLAHELRNPLAPLRGGIDLIRLANQKPHELAAITDIMDRQVDHVVRLVDDLLDASRITQGKIVLQRAPTPLAKIVQLALESNRPSIAQAKLDLVVSLMDESHVLDVDPTRIVQVLSNLLHNATKFTPPGGRITLDATVQHRELVVSVTDTGEGIPTDQLSRVFDLFAQGDHSRREGLGLGLALARMLVELHGGTIVAKSGGTGCGTRFEIRLPLAEAVSTAGERATTRVPSVRSGRQVVIIDDNRDAANALAALINAFGARAHVAYDSISGIARILEVRPDLVLLDLGMPGIDGYEACRRIRDELRDQELVIVAISGWGAPEHKQRAIAAGFTAHLTKPADVGELRRLVVGP